MRRFRQRRLRWWIRLLKQERLLKDEIMFDHAEGEEVLLIGATKLGPCQVRSKTEHPCPHQAVMVFWGIPFCEACAREQEAYFAIGKLTMQAQELASDIELPRRIAEAGKR